MPSLQSPGNVTAGALLAVNNLSDVADEATARANLNLGGIFPVGDYGAIGDGVADDTAEIQAAIDATNAAGGGVVFLPPGTYAVSPSGSAENARCLRMYSNITYRGIPGLSIIKVASGTGNYHSVIQAGSLYSTALENVVFDGITFDLNGANATGSPSASAGNIRAAIAGNNVDGLVVRNCRFNNCWGTWVIQAQEGDCSIVDNVFDNVHGLTSYLDASSLYLKNGNGRVTGNIFHGAGTEQTRTAIEVHGPYIVSENTIEDYQIGVIVAATSVSTTTEGVRVIGNSIHGVLYGVYLYFATTGGDLHGWNVADNYINIDRDAWEPLLNGTANYSGSGIAATWVDAVDVAGLAIHDNQIVYDSISDAGVSEDIHSGCIALGRTGATMGTLIGLSISGNTLIGSCGPGASIECDTQGGSIDGNVIVDVAASAYSHPNETAVGLRLAATHDYLRVGGNALIDTRVTAKTKYGIDTNTGTLTRCRLEPFTAYLADGSLLLDDVYATGRDAWEWPDYGRVEASAAAARYVLPGGDGVVMDNGEIFTVTMESSAVLLIVNETANESALIHTEYTSATITILSNPSGNFVASSTPASGEIGIYKSSSAYVVSIESNYAAAQTVRVSAVGALTAVTMGLDIG